MLLSGDIPGGRGECQQEGLLGSPVERSPDQKAWWPGETVMFKRWWRKTPIPRPLLREPDCPRPAHSVQRDTRCSPPTGGDGPEVAQKAGEVNRTFLRTAVFFCTLGSFFTEI